MNNVLWLNADFMACGSYRCYAPARAMHDTGRYENHFLQHEESYTVGGPRIANLKDIDLLVMQRAVLPVFVDWMKAAKAEGIPVVYETDDDVFHIARHNPVYREWNQHRKLSRKLIELATHVTVSTSYLKESLVEHTDTVPSVMNAHRRGGDGLDPGRRARLWVGDLPELGCDATAIDWTLGP